MNKRNIAVGSSFLTSVGVLAYWTLVFTGVFPLEEIIPDTVTGL